MSAYYYVFSAKSIQEYILKGNKIKFMIGGSELIENLPGKLLTEVLTQAGIEESKYKVLSKAAGSARIVFNDETDAEKLAERLPLIVSRYAPGLEVTQYYKIMDNNKTLSVTIREAEMALAMRRNIQYPEYPVAGPMIKRAERSGKVFVKSNYKEFDLDAGMKAKYDASGKETLAERIGVNKSKLMTDFDDIKGTDNSYIAIVHIDGNKLGDLVSTKLDNLDNKNYENAKGEYMKFSEAINDSSQKSLKDICNIDGIKIRPLVCAGDDVTFVVNPENAVEATVKFINSFIERTETAGIKITACAGIVFVKKSFPFSQAYRLCESLCGYAKKAVNREKSAFAFHRLTVTMADEYESIVRQELTINKKVITRMPYETAEWEKLKELKSSIINLPGGGMRNLLTTLYTDEAGFDDAFLRMKMIADEKYGNKFKIFENAISNMCGIRGSDQLGNDEKIKLIRDVVELISAEGKGDKNED